MCEGWYCIWSTVSLSLLSCSYRKICLHGISTTNRAGTPENAFKVPDGSVISDDDENYPMDEETSDKNELPAAAISQPKPASTFSSDLIDLTEPATSKPEYPMVIDISSPPAYPSRVMDYVSVDSDSVIMVDSSDIDTASAHSPSPDLGEDERSDRSQNDTATLANILAAQAEQECDFENLDDLDGATDYDYDSLRLSSGDDAGEESASDLDDDGMESGSGSENSDDSEDSDMHVNEGIEDDLECELQSELEWEGEYSSGDESIEQDEFEELGNNKNSVMPLPEFTFSSLRTLAPAGPSSASAPSMSRRIVTETPSLELSAANGPTSMDLNQENTNVPSPEELPVVRFTSLAKKPSQVSIDGLLNSTHPQETGSVSAPYETVPPIAISSSVTTGDIRPPSPSDAALAKSLTSYVSYRGNTPSKIDALSMKTGKFEFFAAREENKSKAAKIADLYGESSLFGRNGLKNHHQPANGPFTIARKVSPPPMPVVSVARSDWYERGANFLKTPIPLNQELPVDNSNDDDVAMTSAYTFHQHKLKLNGNPIEEKVIEAPARTHVGISDIVDCCQNIPAGKAKGKRKADEITETLSPTEEQYEAARKKQSELTPAGPATPSSAPLEALLSPPPTAESIAEPKVSETFEPDLPLLPAYPVSDAYEVSRAVRPAKRRRLRKIVERVGYAALGGVTVGAMVIGSLIYTAPSF